MNCTDRQRTGCFEEIIINDCKKLFAYKNWENPSKILKKETDFKTGEAKITRIYKNCVSCNEHKFDNLDQRHFFRNNLFCDVCYEVKYIHMKKMFEKNRSHPKYQVMADLVDRYMYTDFRYPEAPEAVKTHTLPAPFIVLKCKL